MSQSQKIALCGERQLTLLVDFHSLKVRATAISWPEVKIKRASVNSFGYGGSNAHVVLDESKSLVQKHHINHVSSYISDEDDLFTDEEVSSSPHILVFSANDDSSLRAYILLNPAVKVKLSDLSYTLSKRRSHHFQRAYTIVHKASLNEDFLVFGKKSSEVPSIAFIFTD